MTAHTLQFSFGSFLGSPVAFVGLAASLNGGGGASPTLSFVAKAEGGSTMSAAGASIGTAGASRKLIIGVTSIITTVETVNGALTVGGSSATKIAEASSVGDGGGTTAAYAGLYHIDVAAGTTATIALTGPSTNPFDCTFFVYKADIAGNSVDAHTSKSFGHASPGSSPQDLSLDVPADGIAVAVSICYNLSSTASISWTGATQDSTEDLYGSDTRQSAHFIDTTGASGPAFRKTFSPIGGKTGQRQAIRWRRPVRGALILRESPLILPRAA
jgi:hypothetical protein